MARISDIFGGNSLKAEDLKGHPVVVEIEDVTLKDYDGKSKPVLRFVGKEKVFVLNRTNAEIIAHVLKTDEMDEWIGGRIRIKPDKTMFQGKMVACLRVDERLPPGGEVPTVTRKPDPSPAEEFHATDDDVPF